MQDQFHECKLRCFFIGVVSMLSETKPRLHKKEKNSPSKKSESLISADLFDTSDVKLFTFKRGF